MVGLIISATVVQVIFSKIDTLFSQLNQTGKLTVYGSKELAFLYKKSVDSVTN